MVAQMLWHTIPDGGADGETEREEGEREREGGIRPVGFRPVGLGRWDYAGGIRPGTRMQ